jgi:hypothetical protein
MSEELKSDIVPSISDWAGSVQAAVTAIRGAGATSQMILLPGTVSPPFLVLCY